MPPRLKTLDHCAAFDAASQHHQRTIAAIDPEIDAAGAGQGPHLLTVSPISAMLLKLHRKIAAGDACPAGRGRTP
jgi:hypothetical protein